MTKSRLLILPLLSLLTIGQAPDVIRTIRLTHKTGFLNDALSTDLVHVSLTIKKKETLIIPPKHGWRGFGTN